MRFAFCYLIGITGFLATYSGLIRTREKKRYFKKRAIGYNSDPDGLNKLIVWISVNTSTFCLTLVITREPFISFVTSLGAAMGSLLVPGIRKNMKIKRLRKQIEIVLLQLSSTLHGNPSASAAIKIVTKEIAMPAAAELARATAEVDQGMPLEGALRSMAGRFDSELMEMAVDVLLVTRETGGDSAHMMERLADIARQRQMIERKIKLMTSQQKATAVSVTVIPILFILGLCILAPEYTDYLKSPMGLLALSYAVVSISIGFAAIRHMGRIMPEASQC